MPPLRSSLSLLPPASAATTSCSCEIAVAGRPRFFKVFFPCCGSKRLAIPPAFQKHIELKTPECVFLEGPSGNVWNVDLVMGNDAGMAFQNGWEDFVLDHSLRAGDFLVFRYDGGQFFTVVVFDATACEKGDACHVTPCREEEVTVLGESHLTGCANEGREDNPITMDPKEGDAFPSRGMAGRKKPLVACQAFPEERTCSVGTLSEERPHVDHGSPITNDATLDCFSDHGLASGIRASIKKRCSGISTWDSGLHCGPFPQHSLFKKPLISSKYPHWRPPSRSQSDQMVCEVKEEPQEAEESALPRESVRSRRKNIRGKTQTPSGLRAVKGSADKKNGRVMKQPCREVSKTSASLNTDSSGRKVRRGCVESCRGVIADRGKAKTLEAAQLFRSERPLGLCVMRRSYVSYGFSMCLPTSFTKHLPKSNMKMKLWDPRNEPWEVMYVYNERKGAFSGGWRHFSRANNLKTDDVCVFELLEPWEVRVHIFRVGEEIAPLLLLNSLPKLRC